MPKRILKDHIQKMQAGYTYNVEIVEYEVLTNIARVRYVHLEGTFDPTIIN